MRGQSPFDKEQILNDARFAPKEDISEIEKIAWKDGKLQIVPSSFYAQFTQKQLSQFGHVYGVYTLPTTELINVLRSFITGTYGSLDNVIEIGAGNGAIGRALGIPMTDSYQQEDEDIKQIYDELQQPVVSYVEDVVRMDALAAVAHYKPKVIIGSWITHKWKKGLKTGNEKGVIEEKLFDHGARCYIHLGNHNIHGEKPLLKAWQDYKILTFPNILFSRAVNPDKNCMYLFKR
ncbi:hypothetical protein [Xanthocytophaga agilis]|uniref:Methyltransferase n=1 Tax=Xanthocytophaga agilis TaxID=3048010 RepID=A0AAE3UH35_9BACT|nr:hypothetical protein [Xanthocytophaga agilis]MDJ1505020.1 hypothetical protein [Xanthocytophaga agilis]